MSSIDQRIVEMQFNNSQFERGVKDTMKTLDNLKKNLNLDSSTKSMKELQKAGDSFSLAKMADSIGAIEKKFSVMGIAGITAIQNITNSAVNAGKRLAKSLSLDQITAGWTKYTQKTSSVQTIMNATGDSIETVNGYLDKLMWFSDETSYNFTEMTAALGTLTSSGGKVEKLIPLIEGMATATAFAGKTSAEFSRVMYNLNQSYSQGYLSLMDWKSVELAQVGSEQLKQTLIDTAVELGKLKKDAKGTTKTLKGTVVTAANMGSTLNEKWATREVMEGGFGKFASVMEEAYRLVQAGEFETASEALASLEGNFDDVYFKAAKAAQEAKSFGEAIEATKDAVSSGWMKSFELIFGNYEEAKEMWTDLANALWEVFASGGEARNEMLQAWHDAGGRADLLQGIYDSLEALWGIVLAVKDAFADIFPPVTVDTLLKMSTAVKEFGANLKETLNYFEIGTTTYDWVDKPKEQLEELEKALKKGAKGDDVKKLQERLTELGYDVGPAGTDGIFGPKTQEALKKFQEEYGLTVDGIYNADVHKKLGEALGEKNGIGKMLKGTTVYTTIFGDALKRVQRIAKGFFAILKIGVDVLKFLWGVTKTIAGVFSPLADVFLTLGAALGDWFVNLKNSIEESEWFSKSLEKIKNFFEPIKNLVADAGQAILNFFGLGGKAEDSGKQLRTFSDLWAKIKDGVKDSKIWDTITKSWEKLKNVFAGISGPMKIVWKTIKKHFSDLFGNLYDSAAEKIPEFINRIGESFNSFIEWITPFVSKIPGYAISVFNFFKGLFENVKTFVKSDTFKMAWENVRNFFTNIWTAVKGFIPKVPGIIKSVWGFFKDLWESLTTSERVKSAWESTKSFLQNTFNTLKDLFGNVWTAIVGFFQTDTSDENTLGDKLEKRFTAFEKVGDWLKEKWESIKSVFVPFFESVSSFLKKNAWWMISVGGIALLAIAIVKIAKLIKSVLDVIDRIKNGPKEVAKSTSLSSSFLKIAASFAIIAASIYVLGTMDPKKLKQGAIAVGAIAAVLLAFTIVSGVIAKKKTGKALANMGKGLMSLAIGVAVLTAAIYLLGTMKTGVLVRGGLAMIVIVGAMMLMIKKVGNVDIKLKGFVGLAFAIGILAMIVRILGGMSIKKLIKGLTGLALIMLIIRGFMKSASKIASEGNVKLKGFFALAIAIGVMAAIVKILGGMEWGQLAKGLLGLGVIVGILAAFIFVVGKFGNGADFTKATAMLFGFAAFIWMFGEVMKSIKDIDPLVMVAFAGSLALALGALTLACYAANKVGVKGMAKGAAGVSVAMGIVVAAVAGIVAGLGEIDKLTDGGFSDSIKAGGVVLKALSDALSNISPIIGGAILAIVGISEVIGAFGGKGTKAVLFGWLNATIITATIDTVITLSAAVMAGLGALEGDEASWSSQITKGGNVLAALSNSLNNISTPLGIATLAIVGVSEAVGIAGIKGTGALLFGGLNSAIITGTFGLVLSLAAGIVGLLGTWNPEDSWSTDIENGGKVLTSLSKALGSFVGGFSSGYMTELANGVSLASKTSIDEEGITSVIDNATKLKDFYTDINGLGIDAIGEILGLDGFSSFCRSIIKFTLSIKTASAFLTGLPTDLEAKTDSAVTCASAIKTLYDEFPAGDGILAALDERIANWISGGSPFEKFSDSLPDFATKVNDFATNLSGIDPDVISNTELAVSAVSQIAAFCTEIANPDGDFDIDKVKTGLAGWFGGKNETESLIGYITQIGTTINGFNTAIAGLGITGKSGKSAIEEDTKAVINVMTDLATLMTYINSEQVNIAPGVNGSSDSGIFGKFSDYIGQMESLGTEISSFNTNTQDVDTDRFTAIANAANTITTALTSMGAEISGDPVQAVSTAIDKFEKLFSEDSKVDTSNFLESFDSTEVSTTMSTYAASMTTGLTTITTAITNQSESFKTAGAALSTAMMEGLNKIDSASISNVCTSAVKTIRSKQYLFSSAGYYLGAGLAKGLKNSTAYVKAAAAALANATLRKIKDILGIASPSKEAFAIGGFFDEGLANGLTHFGSMVTKSATGIAENTVDTVKGGLTTFSSLIEDGINADPVVRPVVDLSNVTASARSIDGMLSGRTTMSVDASMEKASKAIDRAATVRNYQNGSKSEGKSYSTNNDNSVNVNGNFYVRNDQDIRSLASEIAALTRQEQRSYGG